MESIGERLKHKREALGLSIEQAAETTKCRPELIEAVEEGRAGLFGADVYREGFIRAYAKVLGLDGAALIREQKTEEERAQEALRGIRPHPSGGARLRKTALAVIAIAVAAIVVSVLVDRIGRQPAERREGEVVASNAPADSSVDLAAAGSRKMAYVPISREADGPGGPVPAPAWQAPDDRPSGTAAAEMPEAMDVTTAEQASTDQSAAEADRTEEPGDVGPGSSGTQSAAAGRSLEVAAGRHSVYLILKSGDQVIYDGWVYGGTRRLFKGDQFVIVSLSGTEGVSMTLDGRPVNLPQSDQADQKSIGDWPVR
jgi:cytoskeleton protein RodZ